MTLGDLKIRRRATARRGKEMGGHRVGATYSSNPFDGLLGPHGDMAARCSGVTGLPNASGRQVHAWHLGHPAGHPSSPSLWAHWPWGPRGPGRPDHALEESHMPPSTHSGQEIHFHCMHSFPLAAITNYSKSSVFKQQNLLFYSSGGQKF